MIITDQLDRKIELHKMPVRIISLVPSQTEYLYDLGLGEQIVGQTLFCIHPAEQFKKATKIGGTKKLQLDRIRSLKPDIIIANREENDQKQIETLALEYPVWISDIKTVDDAIDMMEKLGKIFGKEGSAEDIVSTIKNNFSKFQIANESKPKTALYLIWQKPWMAAGLDTFINDMMKHAGFTNSIKEEENRYPKLYLKDMEDLNPNYVFLSSEPFPFAETHVEELQAMLPNSIIKLVDGEMFSWYGSRLLQTNEYFQSLVQDVTRLSAAHSLE